MCLIDAVLIFKFLISWILYILCYSDTLSSTTEGFTNPASVQKPQVLVKNDLAELVLSP